MKYFSFFTAVTLVHSSYHVVKIVYSRRLFGRTFKTEKLEKEKIKAKNGKTEKADNSKTFTGSVSFCCSGPVYF